MKRAICLMALSATALAAGCGDDDSAPETPVTTPTVDEAPALSKEQFITAGDGVCAEVNAALGSLSGETSSSASVAGQRADLYEGMVDRLRDLGAPDDAGLDQFFDAADDLVAAEQEAADASADGDDTALAGAQSEAATAGEEFATAASSYGFEDCGQGATSAVTAPTAPTTAVPVDPAAPVPTAPAAPVAPEPDPGATGAGGGTTGDTGGDTGGGSSGSGGVGPG